MSRPMDAQPENSARCKFHSPAVWTLFAARSRRIPQSHFRSDSRKL